MGKLWQFYQKNLYKKTITVAGDSVLKSIKFNYYTLCLFSFRLLNIIVFYEKVIVLIKIIQRTMTSIWFSLMADSTFSNGESLLIKKTIKTE